MKISFPIKIAAFAAVVSTATAKEFRDWTSRDGRIISGTMVEFHGDSVKLMLANGRKVDVPFKLLSDSDIKYARKHGADLRPEWRGWPNELRMNLSEVNIRIDEERSKNGITYYVTDHFELKSEVELGSRLMLDVGRIFELTYQLIEISPWGIMASPEDGRFKAELYRTREAYIAAGAPEWSGGVYMGARKVFMVPIQSLGIRESNTGYKRDESFSLDTVVHEITHMLMADTLADMPIAVTEGVAEYISHIPLRQGAFRPGSVLEIIREKAERRKTMDFETLLRMTSTQWSEDPNQSPDGTRIRHPLFNTNSKAEQYHSSLLLAYHLMHGLDGGSPKRLRSLILRAQEKAQEREKEIEQYNKAYATYREEIEEFMKLPGVTKTDEGFTYPSDLTPPTGPEPPSFAMVSERERELGNMDIIYDGQSADEFIQEMTESLESAKIDLK